MKSKHKFLVTGGAGFIGSHIVERLLKDGHFVRVLDNFSSGKRENLSFVLSRQSTVDRPQKKRSVVRGLWSVDYYNNFELIKGDIRNSNTCLKATKNIDFVLHQAALRSVPKSLEMPHEYNEVNIDGTVNMLEACLKNKVKRFVFASSSSVYGDAKTFPQKETDPSYLISPYALTKLADEYYCRIFSVNYGLETVGLRYFNVFGPRQALDDEYAVVIPKFIHCILHDEQPPIFGTGEQSRDFTYIDNVIQANILAATTRLDHRPQSTDHRKHRGPSTVDRELKHASNKGCGPSTVDCGLTNHTVLNVANGKDCTVLDLVSKLNAIIGKNIKPKFLPVRAGDVFRTLADISKIQSVLGYKPVVEFEEGLKRTVEYFKNIV